MQPTNQPTFSQAAAITASSTSNGLFPIRSGLAASALSSTVLRTAAVPLMLTPALVTASRLHTMRKQLSRAPAARPTIARRCCAHRPEGAYHLSCMPDQEAQRRRTRLPASSTNWRPRVLRGNLIGAPAVVRGTWAAAAAGGGTLSRTLMSSAAATSVLGLVAAHAYLCGACIFATV